MTSKLHISALALVAAAGWSSPALAQDADAMRTEMAQMRAEMARMAERMSTLESQLQAAEAKADSASAQASEATQVAAAAVEESKGGTKISWKGAPEIEGEGGWSFKPRGRIQVDAGTVSLPDGTGLAEGFGSEVRRARLGVEGDIPGGFGYKFELDFAGNSTEVTDAILTYKDGGTKVSIGQHNNFQSLEELTSSRFISQMERAAFTDAFNFERRVGASVEYAAGDVLLQGGVFNANIEDQPGDKTWSLDGRAVYFPKLGSTQLHIGGSIHHRDLESGSTVRYRQRPAVHFTGTRPINTGNIAADSETGYGAEFAAINGPLHFAGEAFWQQVSRPGMADPTFFGGYAEVGYFFTKGDKRGYKKGTFDRVKPASPVGEGGFGAVQANLRYDFLDLNDAGIVGGKQNAWQASLVWTPTDYTRFMLNYSHVSYDDALDASALSGRSDYSADVFGMRAQVDF